MRWLRRVLWALAILLAFPLGALAWFVARYDLELGSALRATFKSTKSFTVDGTRLQGTRRGVVTWQGNLESRVADEVSGLAASRRRTNLLWAINDSGGSASLFALDTEGRDLGVVSVRGAANVDWEDLAAFELEGQPYLLIADVGDNFAWRPAITLYVVPEPELAGTRAAPGAAVEPRWVLRVRYAEGPRDCEAVAVDARARRVLLLSKRDVPAVLYSVPLVARRDPVRGLENLLVARVLTQVNGIPQPTQRDLLEDVEHGASRSMPTALSLAPDGSAALVFTYLHAYRFARAPSEGWAQAFAKLPARVEMPLLKALEAGTYGSSPGVFYATSEYQPAPLYRFELER